MSTQNLVENAPEANLPAMLVSKLLPYVKSLSDSRKLTDEEVQEDLQYLQTQLKDSFEGLT
jgi:V-type H+-transporting ATPase subunit H